MSQKASNLSDKEQKQAMDAAKAAGRSAPNATDVRDAVKSHELDKDQPKNSGNPNQTGNQAEKKAEMSHAKGKKSSDASRHAPNAEPGIANTPSDQQREAEGKRAPKTEKNH